MKMNFLGKRKIWFLAIFFFYLGASNAWAEIRLWGDKLTVTGLLRHELAWHIADKNPINVYQEDNNRINLSRTWFQTEWTYTPTDVFKLYSKVRVVYDQTDMIDSNVDSFDAFPLATPHYGTTLRLGDEDDHIIAEIWEIYADMDLGKMWFRLGKQQIVWGEMIASRIMDIINPLDLSWHLRFEPEEFENIRIPQWSLRAVYNLPQPSSPWITDLYLEGFYNPGDISPDIWPEPGNPYRVQPVVSSGPPSVTEEKDRWGEDEFGLRFGWRLGQVAGTFNYLYLYSDAGYLQDVSRPGPPPFTYENRYPQTDIYGITMNYAFDIPINTTLTFEGTYSPDEPYYHAEPIGSAPTTPEIMTAGTWKYAIQFQRNTFVFPRPTSAMNIRLQFTQSIVEDHEDLKSTPAPTNDEANTIDSTTESIAFLCDQFFWYNQIRAAFKIIYDLEGAYYMNPGLEYRYGDHWVFDIYGGILGGSETRTGKFGYMNWLDEIFARITYQF